LRGVRVFRRYKYLPAGSPGMKLIELAAGGWLGDCSGIDLILM